MRKACPPDFKADAVRLVREDGIGVTRGAASLGDRTLVRYRSSGTDEAGLAGTAARARRAVGGFHRCRREGLEISLSTLCDLMMRSPGLLVRIAEAMRKEQRAGNWLQADDIGLPVLNGTKGHAVSGCLWVYANAEHVGLMAVRWQVRSCRRMSTLATGT